MIHENSAAENSFEGGQGNNSFLQPGGYQSQTGMKNNTTIGNYQQVAPDLLYAKTHYVMKNPLALTPSRSKRNATRGGQKNSKAKYKKGRLNQMETELLMMNMKMQGA